MNKATDCRELAKALIPLVGNAENIIEVTHCITRLRFILRDERVADTEAIESLPGVVKVLSSGGQYQVVIGANVSAVYRALMAELRSGKASAPDARPMARKPETPAGEARTEDQRPSPSRKDALRSAMGWLSGFLAACMQPLIPVLVSVGLIRALATVLGPSMLGWLDADSGTLRIMNVIGDAGFAALPIFIAWSASKYLKTNTALALFYGTFLVWPDLAAIINSGERITFFALPVPAVSHASQVVPAMLVMAAMYWVERLLKEWLPKDARFIGLPMLETLCMLPLTICAFGHLGAMLGDCVARAVIALQTAVGPLSVALIGASFLFICAAGMHTALLAVAFILIQYQGYDSVALVGAGPAAYACFGIYLAYALLSGDEDARAAGANALSSHAVGGLAESAMFTVLYAHRPLMGVEIVSAFLGALYLGARGVGLYTPGTSNFLAIIQYAGGTPDNLIHAAAGCGISFLSGLVLTAVMQIRARH